MLTIPKNLTHPKAQASKYFFISHPKSGRTWIRYALHLYFNALSKTDDMETFVFRLPRFFGSIHFTHLGYNHKREIGTAAPEAIVSIIQKFEQKKICLFRDERDTVVSFFHQLYHRRGSFKGSLSEFIKHPQYGIESIIRFNSTVYHTLTKGDPKKYYLTTYENFIDDEWNNFIKLLEFLEWSIDEPLLKKSLSIASFDSMKQNENQFQSKRLKPASSAPDSSKIRKGVIGNYRLELSQADIEWVDEQFEKGSVLKHFHI